MGYINIVIMCFKPYLFGFPSVYVSLDMHIFTCAKQIWIGYKNPFTWKNGTCKFKIYQFPKKNL
jgi:hypothetical protein